MLMFLKNSLPVPVRALLRKIVFRYRSHLIQKHGAQALKDILSVVNKDSPRAFIAFGTLLGLYRQQELIAHDIDIDLGCFYEDLPETLKLLEEFGIRFNYKFQDSMLPECGEYRFFYKKIPFDIFIFNKREEQAFCTDFVLKDNRFIVRELVFDAFELTNLRANGYDYCSPSEPEKFLAARYGDSFMTPDKSFDYKNPAPCIIMTDREAKMTLL